MTITIDPDTLNPGQLKFLECRSQYALFSGGWGSGKSMAGLMKLLQLKGANGKRPGLMVAQTYGAMKNNLLDPFDQILEDCGVPKSLRPKQRSTRNQKWLQWADGAKTYLGSAENPKSYDGLTVAYAYGDECRYWKQYAWHVFNSRVRGGDAPFSQIALTSTPALNWMDEEFNTGKPHREIIQASTYENAHNLREGYIDDLKESFSPRMVRAMLEGEFTPLEGAVFEEFDPHEQNSPWLMDFKPTRSYFTNRKVYLCVDPGFRKSAFIFLVQHSPLNNPEETTWIVFDELMPDRRSDIECVEMVNARQLPIDEIWVDPAGDATQSIAGLDTFTALRQIKPRELGARTLRTVGKFRSVSFGVDKLRVLLGGYARMPRRIKFARHLVGYERKAKRGIIRDIARLSYPEKEGRAISDEPLKDGVSDHSTDALRYWGVGRWLCEPMLRKKDPMLRKLSGPLHKSA